MCYWVRRSCLCAEGLELYPVSMCQEVTRAWLPSGPGQPTSCRQFYLRVSLCCFRVCHLYLRVYLVTSTCARARA